jgi:hypothetical protein
MTPINMVLTDEQLESLYHKHIGNAWEFTTPQREYARAIVALAHGVPDTSRRSFSDFIRNATVEEKTEIYGDVIQAATERQKAVIDGQQPVDMVLHCPKCGMQHIDAPEWERDVHDMEQGQIRTWANPPHKSHLCHGCKTIWRPADVPTNGVAAITTRGRADTWPVADDAVDADAAKMRAEFMAWVQDQGCDTDGAWSAWQAAWRRPTIKLPSDERLLEVARDHGLRSYMHGVNSTAAKSLLRTYLEAVLKDADGVQGGGK